jgi:2-polyprenyl-3-methyl-5-hydroxy-6-metoxy-1,4-benzoquinol methylase
VPCFIRDAPYWGELPQAEMKAVIKRAQKGHWRDALETIPEAKKSEIIAYASDETRGWWRYLLPDMTHGKVLDVGAGLGAITFSLAKTGYEVVTVDSVMERSLFIKIRADQDKIHNIQVACASALELPFSANSFDMVIMNGVLEWLGLSDASHSPEKLQKKALDNIFNLLKPRGILYLAIENRISAIYFLGFKDPHSGLRFTTIMPRKIADWYARLKHRGGYRTYIYSKFGYEKMLRGAGFNEVRFFLPLPSYRNFGVIFPLGERRIAKYCLSHIWNKRHLRSLRLIRPLLRVFPAGFFLDYFAPDYCIIAIK